MKRILGIALFVALIGAPVFAAGSPGATSSTGTGGELGFGIGQADVSQDTTGVDSAQFLGIRGGYDLNQAFEVEGQFSSSSESGQISGTDVDTTMRVLMVNGVYNFRPAKKEIVPYVLAGIGRADVEVKAAGSSADDSSMAYQVGGGTRIFFGKTKRTAVRMDLSLLRNETFNDSSTDRTLSAGLTWRLGGR